MNLDYDIGVATIIFGLEQETEEKIFQRWIPYQGQIPYDEFRNSIKTGTNINAEYEIENVEEIMNQVKSILEGVGNIANIQING